MTGERFDDINELLLKLQNAIPEPVLWECLECGNTINLAADDYCPICGVLLPEIKVNP